MTGSPLPGSVRSEITENANKAGNPVKTSTGASQTNAIPYADSSGNLAHTSVTASKPVYIDSSSVPQTGSFPFALPAVQATSTLPLLDLTGVGSAGLLTTTIVKASEVTTATIAGYIRVAITDTGDTVTDGSYYFPFYTIL